MFLSCQPADLKEWDAWTQAFAEQNPSSAAALYLRGDALGRLGRFQDAEGSFTRALDLNGTFGLAQAARGVVRALFGKQDEAYLDLLTATRTSVALADAYANLGCYEVIAENADGALAAFNEALRLDPSFALAYNGRGCSWYGMGKPDEAQLDFETAANLCPGLVVTRANEGSVLGSGRRRISCGVHIRRSLERRMDITRRFLSRLSA